MFFNITAAAIPENMRFISRVVGSGYWSVVFGSNFSTTRGAVVGCRNRSVVFGFIFSTTRRRRVGCGNRSVVFEPIIEVRCAFPPSCLFFVSWRPTVTQGGAASITMILSMVLRGSERLRCAQEEKMVASKVFRK